LAEGNVWEKMFGVYVNNILSRPGTHVRNFLASALFIPYRAVERGTAAGIGAVRQMVGVGSQDRYVFSELPAMIASTPTAIFNGFNLAAEAWKTGVPKNWTDPAKIARQQSRLELFNHKNDGSLLSTFLKGANYVTTLPGRSLLTADEFFKGINYTHELAAEATRTGVLKFEEAIAAGRTMDEAEALAKDAVDKFVSEPPEHLMQLSEVGTFTQKLEGRIGQLQANANPNTPLSFLIRTQLPFISTPVNVISETVARTPLAGFSKQLRADLKKGGTKESDIALAKIGLGSGAIYGFTQFAASGQITGSGPGSRGTREAMLRQGWQPYSIVLDVGENRELYENKFPGMARFGTGEYEGKVFISYQGLEPVGALMAIGADIADFGRYQDSDDAYLEYVHGAVFGVSTYMMEHPFLQGVNGVFDLLRKGFSGDPSQTAGWVNDLSEYLVGIAGKTVPIAGSSFGSSVRQIVDPMAREFDVGPGYGSLKGLMDGLSKIRSQTVGLSDDMTEVLNIWSEPQSYEYAYAPLRMKAGKQREADAYLIQLNVNQQKPQKFLSSVDQDTGISVRIRLKPEELNEMLVIANKELMLEDRVLAIGRAATSDPTKAPSRHWRKVIKGEFDKVFEDARSILVSRNPEIQQRIAEEAAKIKEAENEQ
jgi:hypothetical protein